MISYRRAFCLAITALLVVACGAPAASQVGTPTPSDVALATDAPSFEPSAVPTQSASPSLTPGPTIDPNATPLPTQDPECEPVDGLDLTDLEVDLGSVDADGNGGSGGVSVGRLAAFLQVTRITEVSGLRRSVVPPPMTYENERGQLLGGLEFIAYPSTWVQGLDLNPRAMVSAVVTLTVEGQSPIDLPTRFLPGNRNFDQFAATVPDASGPGTLTFDLVWADRCFRYESKTTIDVDVVPLSMTAGCMLGLSSYGVQVRDLLDGSLRIGSSSIHAFSARNQAKFLFWGNPGIDAFIAYAFDKNDPAIVAAPNSALIVEQVSPDIELGGEISVSVWTRASVRQAIRDYPPRGLDQVLERTPTFQPDGTFRIRVPDAPGRYVAGVTLDYDSQCSSGELWFLVNIDVVAPTASPAPLPSTAPA